MRISLYSCLLLPMLFLACNAADSSKTKLATKKERQATENKKSDEKSKDTSKKMDTSKELNHSLVADTTKEQEELTTVQVDFVTSYCGGAYPSDEILKEYEKQYPLANSYLLLKNKKGERFTVKTNAKGVFQEVLADGTYTVYMTKKVSPSSTVPFDPSCEVWLKSEFTQFTVKANKVLEREIILYFGCNPCLPPRP